MTQSDHTKPILDNSFSAFITGLTVGVAGALLLGTEEGRKLTQRAIQAIPKDLTQLFSQSNGDKKPSPPQVLPSPDTLDSYSDTEPPPPPPPPPPIKSPPKFFTS